MSRSGNFFSDVSTGVSKGLGGNLNKALREIPTLKMRDSQKVTAGSPPPPCPFVLGRGLFEQNVPDSYLLGNGDAIRP